MSKNIVICSDGTGNSPAKFHGTNVWRICNAVDRHDLKLEQITYYDDGVGTDSVRLLRLLGGAFGSGLTRNILQAYVFLAMNYKPGDKVFLFGFSRGAFTVRSLAGLIGRCGLIDRKKLIEADSHKDREAVLRQVMKAYRSTERILGKRDESHQQKELRIREELGLCNLKPQSIPIHFIGVWDTVDAVGMPFDEMKEVLGYFWARFFKRRLWHFNDNVPHHCIRYAYQALALDDERKTFHPLLWETEEAKEGIGNQGEGSPESLPPTPQRTHISQVWFAGMHANVGGGYPKDGLAHVSLNWMIEKAESCGLKFLQEKKNRFREEADINGHMYNSRTGIRMFYRPACRDPYMQPKRLNLDDNWSYVLKFALKHIFAPRGHKKRARIPNKPTIHDSVFARSNRASNEYAPKILAKGPNKICSMANIVNVVGLKQKAIYRLRELEITHARLHQLFIALLGFFVLWVLTFTFETMFSSFFQFLGNRLEQLKSWWTNLKGFDGMSGVESLIKFSTAVSDAFEKFLPKIASTLAGFVTRHPVEVALHLGVILLVWKANRLVEVESKLYSFKRWHDLGDNCDVTKALRHIDFIMRSRSIGIFLFLFVLMLVATGLEMATWVVMQIPPVVALMVGFMLLLTWRLRIFDR